MAAAPREEERLISAEYSRDGGRICVRVVGHATYAPEGYDIVCAGVSALCAAFDDVLGRLRDVGAVRKLYRRFGKGAMLCSFYDGDYAGTAVTALVFGGLMLISEKYPHLVKVYGERLLFDDFNRNFRKAR